MIFELGSIHRVCRLEVNNFCVGARRQSKRIWRKIFRKNDKFSKTVQNDLKYIWDKNSTLFIRALETKTIRQAQKEREQSRDFLGVGTACACVCAKHRREQCRGSISSVLRYGAAVSKHRKNGEALLPSVLSTHTQAHALHPKSRVTGPFLFVLASLFELPIRGEYVLFYPFKSFEVNAMDLSFECMESLKA